MLILGRSPNLILGFLSAVLNVVILFHVGGFDPTPEQIVGANGVLFALVALIANTDSIQVAAGKAAAVRQNGSTK